MKTPNTLTATPEPPYYVVIFTSRLAESATGYAEAAEEMVRLSTASPGFLGMESARNTDGAGITVCYWRDEASILAWKRDPRHLAVQQAGRATWYERYEVRIAKVERAYGFAREPAP